MPDHPLLIGVGDRARFQFAHRGKRLLHLRSHFLEKVIRKTHPADVDREIEIVVAQKIFLEARPERSGCHFIFLTERASRLEQDCS